MNDKKIILCICMTCGVRNDQSNPTGYCQNDHDNWLEYTDVIEKNNFLHQAVKKSGLTEAEFTKKFMDDTVLKISMDNQRYCVTAADKQTNVRESITGSMRKADAEEMQKQFCKNSRMKKIYKYFKVADYPYKKRKHGEKQ